VPGRCTKRIQFPASCAAELDSKKKGPKTVPCFRSLRGFRSRTKNPDTGKRSIVFSIKEADLSLPEVILPCGQCMDCRLRHSKEWALRCMHEASLYENNCFVTLTYKDECLPPNGSLDYEAPVLFMKRLRKRFGSGVRSFGCAEYGELLQRPHYHLCIFNHDFSDKILFKKSREFPLYTSADLAELWPAGHSTVGALTFESAAYVARYVTKKMTGAKADSHYERLDEYGEYSQLLPERSICVSRRPGLGKLWYERFGSYSRAHDHLILRGHKVRPPKYYDRLFDIADPEKFASVKANRKIAGEKASEVIMEEDRKNFSAWDKDSAPPTPRIYVMEEVQALKFNLLKRGIENV